MATKKKAAKKAVANKTPAPKTPVPQSLPEAVSDVASELRPLYQIEQLADHVGSLILPLSMLADAHALGIIAQYGTNEERRIALDKLKNWYEEFRG